MSSPLGPDPNHIEVKNMRQLPMMQAAAPTAPFFGRETSLPDHAKATRQELANIGAVPGAARRSVKPAWMTNPEYCAKVGTEIFMAGKPGMETGEVKKMDPGDPLGDFFTARKDTLQPEGGLMFGNN